MAIKVLLFALLIAYSVYSPILVVQIMCWWDRRKDMKRIFFRRHAIGTDIQIIKGNITDDGQRINLTHITSESVGPHEMAISEVYRSLHMGEKARRLRRSMRNIEHCLLREHIESRVEDVEKFRKLTYKIIDAVSLGNFVLLSLGIYAILSY